MVKETYFTNYTKLGLSFLLLNLGSNGIGWLPLPNHYLLAPVCLVGGL